MSNEIRALKFQENIVSRETYSDIIVSSRSGQSTLPVCLKVHRIDGRAVVVPIDHDWSSLHLGYSSAPAQVEGLWVFVGLIQAGVVWGFS
jgi:hypothetical protein